MPFLPKTNYILFVTIVVMKYDMILVDILMRFYNMI